MKKSLSLLLAIALVFGLFASMASAATPAEAGAKLKELGVIQGDQNGGLLEGSTWERQDLVVVLSRLLGKEAEAKATAKSHTFKDVKGTFYDGYLSWAVAKGYITGQSATVFGWDQKLTTQDFAAVVLRALGVDTTGENYAKTGELAVKAGIFAEGTDFKAPAKRGDTYVALVTALETEVAGTGKKLGEILNLPGYANAALAVAKATQTGGKKITVEFNRALKAEEVTALTAEVKNGQVPYAVTIKVAEDKKSAALEATFLPAAEYDVTINKLAAVKVTVVAPVVAKIEIGASALQATYDQDLGIKALNQFNEEVKNEIINVNVYSSQNGTLTVPADNIIDLNNEKVDNTIVVTATHYSTGLSASKTFKLVAGSSATSITLGTVAPLKDKTRITAGENDLILPVTLKDQYGSVIKLPATTGGTANVSNKIIGGINFVVSDKALVDASSFAVDSNGVVTFDAKAAGTVVLTAVNPATGASASIAVKIEDAATLKTLQVSAPGSIVVVGEAVTFPYVAADTFGAPIAAKDVPSKVAGLADNSTGFDIQANGLNVQEKWKANGDLQLTFPAKGTVNVIVWYKGAIVSQFNVTVNDVAYPVSISGTKDIKTTMTDGATQDLDLDNVVVVDNYGRAMTTLPLGWTLSFDEESGNVNTHIAGGKIIGDEVGSEKITAKLDHATATDVTFEIGFTVIKNEDVKTLAISTVGTVYAAGVGVTTHDVALDVTGKTATGTDVAIVATDFYDLITSSDSNIASIAGASVHGVAKGTATVSVWKDGSKLGEQTVTVSDVAPVATTVKFADAEKTLAGAVGAHITVTPEVKDQYGKVKADAGKFYSSNKDVATVDLTTGQLTKVANGVVTITYVTANGISATIIVNVENA